MTSMLYVLKKHNNQLGNVVNCICTFSKGRISHVLNSLIKNLFPSPLEYVVMINDFLHIIIKSKEFKQEIVDHGVVDFWLEMSIKQADNDNKHSSEERTVAVAFLADLWEVFPEKLDLRDDLAEKTLTMFKRGSKDKNRPLRICSLTQMFRLLDIKTQTKDKNAPVLYKNIAHALIDNI